MVVYTLASFSMVNLMDRVVSNMLTTPTTKGTSIRVSSKVQENIIISLENFILEIGSTTRSKAMVSISMTIISDIKGILKTIWRMELVSFMKAMAIYTMDTSAKIKKMDKASIIMLQQINIPSLFSKRVSLLTVLNFFQRKSFSL